MLALESLISELTNRPMLSLIRCHLLDFEDEKSYLDKKISTLEYIKTRHFDLIDLISERCKFLDLHFERVSNIMY